MKLEIDMNRSFAFLLFASIFGVTSCAPSRFVEPLEKDELTVGFSFGGPVIEFNGPIPMPMTSVEVGYGLDTNLTFFGAIHTTAAYFGNVQLDAGVTYKFLDQNKFIPNVSVSPSVNFMYTIDDRSGKLWPILDVNAYWNYGDRSNYWYAGMNNYFELSKTMANDQPQAHHWIFNPQIGHVIKGKNDRWQLTTEFKFLAPYIKNWDAFVPYKSLTGGYGATGFYIGCRWKLGNKDN